MHTSLLSNPKDFFIDSRPVLSYIQKNRYDQDFHPYRCVHSHEQLELILFVTGKCEYTHNARKYSIYPQSIAICNQGTFHAENYPENNGYFISIGISGLHIPELKRDHLIPEYLSPIITGGDRFSEILALADMLIRMKQQNTGFAKENLNYLLRTLLLQIHEMAIVQSLDYARNPNQIPLEQNLMRKARLFIEKNYRANLSISEIAANLGISPSQLTHSFKRYYNTTVMQYAISLRIGDAQTLLVNTRASIIDISQLLGFNSPNSFFIAFNKKVGMSPSAFRTKFRNF